MVKNAADKMINSFLFFIIYIFASFRYIWIHFSIFCSILQENIYMLDKAAELDVIFLALGLAKAVFLWYTNICINRSTRGTAG